MMFDYVVSNPPYQKKGAGTTSHTSIYPSFILYGSNVANYTMMIHPVRSFLVNTRVDKSVVDKLIRSKNIRVVDYMDNSKMVFPTVDIMGGVVISYLPKDTTCLFGGFEDLVPDKLSSIKEKVAKSGFTSIISSISTASVHKVSTTGLNILKDKRSVPRGVLQTNIFDKAPELFSDNKQDDDTYSIIGRQNGKRVVKYILKDHVDVDPLVVSGYNIAIPASHGGTQRGSRGDSVILQPNELCTATFILFGTYSSYDEAKNVERYLNTRFARALLSIKKITQHNSRKTWEFVPDIGDYVGDSVIDWSGDVEQQLYNVFGLSSDEQKWLQDNITQNGI